MDSRAAKLALARAKLKNHQEKKVLPVDKDEATTVKVVDVQQDNEQHFIEKQVVINTPEHSNNTNEQNLIELPKKYNVESDINVTEILVSNKINLETQIGELQTKYSQLENDYTLTTDKLNISMQQIHNLQNEMKTLHENYLLATKDLQERNSLVNDLHDIKSSLLDRNNNLTDQLEFTKTMLTAKETENASLHSQLSNLQNQLDGTSLQLQQLINGSSLNEYRNSENENSLSNEVLLQKISALEHQLKQLQKERDQLSVHYEHYVAELNGQLKSMSKRNEDMSKEIFNLSNRESSLIDQISDMEIRLQNYDLTKQTVECESKNTFEINELQKHCNDVEQKLQDFLVKYGEVERKLSESEAKVKELVEAEQSEMKKEDISLLKLNADIASDKVAAQRATEQNRKLKKDMQELEEAFVKMSQDKLELTEKIAAEKFLNRELTIKLAEIDEKAKDMHIKLMAKDEEMIRLQASYRAMETEFKTLSDHVKNIEIKNDKSSYETETAEIAQPEDDNTVCIHQNCSEEHMLIETDSENNSLRIKKEEAMSQLQQRFLKIMEEVADLSDEKHRLEHIILQLQNETDTICEYVALYQQQRSALKKRDEERTAQIKIFQDACDNLKNQVEELSNVLIRFAEDKELTSYFQVPSRQNDIEKVMKLISHLKSNCLIDPKRKSVEFKDFYPCNCCSGKLLEV